MNRRASTYALPFFLALTFAFFCVFAPRFATSANLENLMAGYAFVAIVAIGQSFPILLKGIDLSIGAIVALAGIVTLDLSLIFHWPGLAVIPAVLVVAALAGAVNGLLIVYLRLQPFIATLATLAAYRGLVFLISGRQLFPELSTTPITDPWIVALDTYFDIGSALGVSDFIQLPGLPLSFVILVVLLIGFQVLLLATRFGRDLYAVGGNHEAARLAGIRTRRVTILAYTISGTCAGVAALLLVARLTTSTEALGNGMELTAISAAVIGGVSLQGGVGTAWGPVLGAFLLGVVLIGLTLLGVTQFVQQILTGAILLAAVCQSRLIAARQQRRTDAALVAGG